MRAMAARLFYMISGASVLVFAVTTVLPFPFIAAALWAFNSVVFFYLGYVAEVK